METAGEFARRIRERIRWVLETARLGATFSAKMKLVLGGVWLLLNDTWKSNLRFAAEIEQFGRSLPFYFEDIGDFGLFCEIFRTSSYEHLLPETAEVVVDLGANIGVSALYFRLRYPEATIYCFEPDPANLRRLRAQAAVLENTRVRNVALWSSNGTLSFYTDPHRGSLSAVSPVYDRQQEIHVQARTLGAVLEGESISVVDVLKVDVEGAEEEALVGFEEFDRIQVLCGEVHADLCDADAVFRTLDDHFDVVEKTPMGIDGRWYVTACLSSDPSGRHADEPRVTDHVYG
jgi:FkbM family methyltransferase